MYQSVGPGFLDRDPGIFKVLFTTPVLYFMDKQPAIKHDDPWKDMPSNACYLFCVLFVFLLYDE